MENPFDLILERLNRIEKAIEELKGSTNSNDASINANGEFMNIDQVASFVGLSKDTIYGLTHKKIIPHFKTGKKLYFDKSEVSNWISSKRVVANQETGQTADEVFLEIQ